MINLIKNLLIKRRLEKTSNWFEKHSPAQQRFEDVEDWLEEIEERTEKLEEWSHPPVAPGGTTELKNDIKNLELRIKHLEEHIGH